MGTAAGASKAPCTADGSDGPLDNPLNSTVTPGDLLENIHAGPGATTYTIHTESEHSHGGELLISYLFTVRFLESVETSLLLSNLEMTLCINDLFRAIKEGGFYRAVMGCHDVGVLR